MTFSISPPDPKNYHSAVSYEEDLKKNGWALINGGAYSRVYRNSNDDCVIKVSEVDDCYMEYAYYAEKSLLDCVPKLKVIYKSEDWFVTHIEFLSALSSDNIIKVRDWFNSYINAKKNNSNLPEPKEWSKLADDLRKIAQDNKCGGFDMKPDNAMQRGSTVVFTDPLAS